MKARLLRLICIYTQLLVFTYVCMRAYTYVCIHAFALAFLFTIIMIFYTEKHVKSIIHASGRDICASSVCASHHFFRLINSLYMQQHMYIAGIQIIR